MTLVEAQGGIGRAERESRFLMELMFFYGSLTTCNEEIIIELLMNGFNVNEAIVPW
ncbi:MAG: hypothetical protein FWE91_11280 [Defluviitaleaceae bacterium]|nr:hypothetical protein [Defluviitaleaceae bacterium]MCL2837132.1 hypothetical protein [Defluviitaleaceae bacterium]